MAEQHLAEPVNVDAARRWPFGKRALVFETKLLRCPVDDLPVLFGNFTDLLPGHLSQHDAFAVTVDELNWNVELEQTIERLARHRAGQDIAANHDAIDAGFTNILEDRLECREVTVDVVKSGNAHG
jgi:hypothetical protein